MNLVLQGGSSGTTPFAMLGFRAVDQGSAYTVTGPISVTVSQDISATGGSVVAYAFVQVGHGGADTVFDLDIDGDFVGPVAIQAGGNVTFLGNNNGAYAQLGNGGWRTAGNHSGDHRLDAGGHVIFQAGGDSGYAHTGQRRQGCTGQPQRQPSPQRSQTATSSFKVATTSTSTPIWVTAGGVPAATTAAITTLMWAATSPSKEAPP